MKERAEIPYTYHAQKTLHRTMHIRPSIAHLEKEIWKFIIDSHLMYCL
jgi:hypothetical protein